MPFVKIWIHLIWSVKYRQSILEKDIRRKLFDHISEYARNKDIHLDCINGYDDHVHVLLSLKADHSISKVTQLLKGESSHWVNSVKLIPFRFEWQEEYFAMSVDDHRIVAVRDYISGQEEHHRKKTFAEEYGELIREFNAIGKGLKPQEMPG